MRLDLDTGFEALLSDPYAPHPIVNRHILNGGGGGQTTTQTQQSESGPPSFLQPYLQSAVGKINSYYDSNPNAPAYYSGETVAPINSTQSSAINGIGGLTNSSTLNAANSSLTNFANGAYVDPTTNPDYQKALAASHQPYVDQFNQQILPGVQATFEGAGRYGSGANQATTQQALTNLNTTINNADAQAGSQYYQNALNQMLQANSLIPSVNNAQLQNYNSLLQGGTLQQQTQQNQDAANQAAYNYNTNAYPNYIAQYGSILNSLYPGGSSSSSGTSYQPVNSSGGLMSGIMGGAGLALQALPLFGVSDARVKENIAPVGKTFDGQDLWFFTYKGDPTPHVGLMAQQVEERDPDAVITLPSGVKAVDYPKALGLF